MIVTKLPTEATCLKRMPGKCAGCGKRVELSIGERSTYGQGGHVRKLPTQWVDPGTFSKHVCGTG